MLEIIAFTCGGTRRVSGPLYGLDIISCGVFFFTVENGMMAPPQFTPPTLLSRSMACGKARPILWARYVARSGLGFRRPAQTHGTQQLAGLKNMHARTHHLHFVVRKNKFQII